MSEDKKKKITIGYKKLKNVDSFDQFDIHKEELQGGVNESASDLDIDTAFDTLNFLHEMINEGYIKNGKWDVDPSDLPEDHQDRFTSRRDMDEWLIGVLPIVRRFVDNLDEFYG